MKSDQHDLAQSKEYIMVNETWRKHPTANVAVSTDGQVLNLNTGRLIQPSLVGGGSSGPSTGSRHREARYLRVEVPKRNGSYPTKTAGIAALVLETYVGPKPEGNDVDHIDSVKTNNRLDNLRYLDSKINRGRGSVNRNNKES